MLSRGLFFARVKAFQLGDPWEGAMGELDAAELRQATIYSQDNGEELWRAAVDDHANSLNSFGISCWDRSECESAAFWKIYVPLGLGVAIQSTVGRVQKVTATRNVIARAIDYRGHRNRHLGRDPLELLTTKRHDFQHEAEIRFLFHSLKMNSLDSKCGA